MMKIFKNQVRRQNKDNTGAFTDDTFAAREHFRDSYSLVANSLCRHIDFQNTLDVGCANGFLMDFLHQNSKLVSGIEISVDARKHIPSQLQDAVQIGDVTEMHATTKFDLVTCIEVAEHIEEAKADRLVQFLTNSSKRFIYFTAAYPDQPGHGHINCQPQFYWMSKFKANGFDIEWNRTKSIVEDLKAAKKAPWLSLNSIVFERTES